MRPVLPKLGAVSTGHESNSASSAYFCNEGLLRPAKLFQTQTLNIKCVWLKFQQEGLAHLSLCFLLPRCHFGYHLFEPQPNHRFVESQNQRRMCQHKSENLELETQHLEVPNSFQLQTSCKVIQCPVKLAKSEWKSEPSYKKGHTQPSNV